MRWSSGSMAYPLQILLVQDSLHVSFCLQAIIAFALAHPTATRSICCAIDLRPVCLSQVKPKLRKKVHNSKLFVSRCTPFIIYFSQNHSSASFFSCLKQRGDYLTSSKIKCFDSQYFKTIMVQIWRII